MSTRRMPVPRGMTCRIALAIVAVGIPVARPARVAAQMIINHSALDPGRPNLVQFRSGVEYGFIAGAGYGRALTLGSRTLLLSGSVTTPWAGADTRDYGARVGATIDIAGTDRWRLLGGLGGRVQGTANDLSRMTTLGAEGLLVAGYWSPRWFVATEGGYDNAIATHIEHTDHYRAVYHAGARDGWYRDTGSNIRLGLAGGVTFGPYDFVLRAGQARDREGHHQLLPAYAVFELNRRF